MIYYESLSARESVAGQIVGKGDGKMTDEQKRRERAAEIRRGVQKRRAANKIIEGDEA